MSNMVDIVVCRSSRYYGVYMNKGTRVTGIRRTSTIRWTLPRVVLILNDRGVSQMRDEWDKITVLLELTRAGFACTYLAFASIIEKLSHPLA